MPRSDPLIRVMSAARADLERTNALLTSAEADHLGVILRLPTEPPACI